MDAAKLLDTFIAWFIGTKHERDIKKTAAHRSFTLRQREGPLFFPASAGGHDPARDYEPIAQTPAWLSHSV